jgi:hypothetical protein
MSPYRTVNVTKLVPGDTLVEPVFGEGLTKLLGAGCAVNDQLIQRLAERGVTEVVVKIPKEQIEKHHRNAQSASIVRPESIVDASRLVEHSCQCGSTIAIQAPAADLPVAIWICKTCGAAYFGGVNSAKSHGVEMLAAHGGNSLAGDDQAIPDDGPTCSGAEATPSGSAVDTLKGIDRRQHTRYSIGVPVVAVPLGANFTILGPAVRMTTRDISKSGVGLAYARFTDAPYFVIDFTSAGIELLQVLMKVVRVSNNGPNYELAGKFINRLHCAKWSNERPSTAEQITKEPI